MDWTSLASTVVPALPAVLSLFGSKKPRESEASRAQAALLRQQADIANQQRGYATKDRADYDQYNPLYKSSVNAYANYLRSDPNTDAARTQRLGYMTSGLNDAYARGSEALATTRARQGVLDSSDILGGQVGLENAKAGAISNAYQQNYASEQADAERRKQALVGLLGNTASGYANMASNNLNAASSGYGNVASQYGQRAQIENAQDANYQAQQGQNIGQMASVLGTIFAQGGRSKATTPPPTPSGGWGGVSTARNGGYDPVADFEARNAATRRATLGPGKPSAFGVSSNGKYNFGF